MNQVIRNIHERRSVRKFTGEPVDKEHMQIILDAARVAPSGNNLQPWFFVVVSDKDLLNKMAKAVTDKVDYICGKMDNEESARKFKKYSNYYTFFNIAPTVIVALRTWNNYYMNNIGITDEFLKKVGMIDAAGNHEGYPDIQSVAASIQNMLLAAASLGYGTCWMTGPVMAQKELAELLDLEGIRKAQLEKRQGHLKPAHPDDPWEILALIPIGKRKSLNPNRQTKPKPKGRKQLADIVSYIDPGSAR